MFLSFLKHLLFQKRSMPGYDIFIQKPLLKGYLGLSIALLYRLQPHSALQRRQLISIKVWSEARHSESKAQDSSGVSIIAKLYNRILTGAKFHLILKDLWLATALWQNQNRKLPLLSLSSLFFPRCGFPLCVFLLKHSGNFQKTALKEDLAWFMQRMRAGCNWAFLQFTTLLNTLSQGQW